MNEQAWMTDNEAAAARVLLAGTGLSLTDAARLTLELKEAAGRGRTINALRKIIKLGEESLARSRLSVSVDKLYRIFLEKKEGWRSRTERDYKQVMRRIGEQCPEFLRCRARAVTHEQVQALLDSVFPTAQQRRKGRAILHSIFSYAEKRRWVNFNPVTATTTPRVREKEIVPLTLEEVRRLLAAARRCEAGLCLIPFALMLFGGIRPREMARLRWGDIDLEENVVRISPYNSKTGGARHVTIHEPLRELLLERKDRIEAPGSGRELIAPRNFDKRWLRVRRNAGWNTGENPWQQDVLRHTFASYHAKFFKNFHLLQQEMGHASANLLRTRYLSMSGITAESASRFWNAAIVIRDN
ncbi:MAG: tyrosine-type recombinase/integrase [Opitutales bacterium]|nr:tyrosine-type recombinase/integrase [Opitutales bacterium]